MRLHKLFTTVLPLFLFSHVLTAQTDPIGSNAHLPPHPRILLLKGEEDAVIKTIRGDKIWDKMQQATRDPKYLQRAEKEMLAIAAFSDWNQVCNAGMTYGALAIYEDDPAPDGAYPEGYGYWGYGTSFNVLLISALDKAFGKDFGLSDMPGFLKTAGFLENMTGPTGKPFNFSDSHDGGGIEPAMFWFAQKNGDPSLLWVERSRLMNEDPKKHVNNRLLPAMMLWGKGSGKNPVALMRTSWTDSSAIFVGMKGGSAGVNHAHMDIGSFVMDADGVRWAMDLGAQDYESLESKGMQIFGRTQDAQRWTIFRYVNQVHNTLTINDQHQQVAGYAPITGSFASKDFMNAVVDLSSIYKGSLASARRSIAIVDRQWVVVRDEIRALDTTTTIRWTLLTPAEIRITGKNSAELTSDGKKLFLRVDTPGDVTMKTWPTDPPPNNYDAPNPGTIAGKQIITDK